MIQQSPAKAERFLNAINKAALEKCRDINNKVKQMMDKELQEAQDRIDKESHRKIDRQLAKVRAEYKMEIAAFHSEHKNAIYKKRLAYENEIFDEARHAIEDFVSSDEYEGYLINHAAQIAEISNAKCEVFMRPADCEKYSQQIKSLFNECTIHPDKSIEIGGIKVKDYDEGLLYDSTLDSKFAQQKEWFYNNSSLNIEII